MVNNPEYPDKFLGAANVATKFIYEDPEHWRQRGEEMRVVAEGMKNHHTRSIAVGIANDYERLAKSVELIADGRGKPKPKAAPTRSGSPGRRGLPALRNER